MRDVATRSKCAAALVIGVTVMFCLRASAEEATAQPPLGQTEAAAKSAYSKKLICTTEPVMGSNIKKKTCRTQEEIDEQRAASHNMMNDLNQSKGRNYGGSG